MDGGGGFKISLGCRLDGRCRWSGRSTLIGAVGCVLEFRSGSRVEGKGKGVLIPPRTHDTGALLVYITNPVKKLTKAPLRLLESPSAGENYE